MTLERLIAELKSGKLDTKKQVEHLKMIVHLVGDIHQPLHVGIGPDRGGNSVKVNGLEPTVIYTVFGIAT